MSEVNWVRLQGKTKLHICTSSKGSFGLTRLNPICGATYGYPFEYSKYGGEVPLSMVPECPKCIRMSAPPQACT